MMRSCFWGRILERSVCCCVLEVRGRHVVSEEPLKSQRSESEEPLKRSLLKRCPRFCSFLGSARTSISHLVAGLRHRSSASNKSRKMKEGSKDCCPVLLMRNYLCWIVNTGGLTTLLAFQKQYNQALQERRHITSWHYSHVFNH